TSGGTSGAQTFTVIPPAPTAAGVLSAAGGTTGSTVHETVAGTNFIAGATQVTVSGTGVSVTNITVAASGAAVAAVAAPPGPAIAHPSTVTVGTSLSFDLIIGKTAEPGDRLVTISTPRGTIAGLTFTVTAAPAAMAVIKTFTASPPTIITGQSSTLSW